MSPFPFFCQFYFLGNYSLYFKIVEVNHQSTAAFQRCHKLLTILNFFFYLVSSHIAVGFEVSLQSQKEGQMSIVNTVGKLLLIP